MENKSKRLYMKDKGGDTLLTSVITYKDEVLRVCPVFESLPKLLNEFHQFVPKDDDVWILAYPKCGTHWLTEITGILSSGKLEPIKQYKESMMVEAADSIADIENIPSPRILNTHLKLKYIPNAILEKSKIICAVRNPKSAMVSYFHHTKKMPRFFEYDGSFENYLSLLSEGLDDISGSWYEYVQTNWDTLRDKNNVHFVFYEELIKNRFAGIKKISEFLELERDDKFIQGVVEMSSFTNMAQSIGKDLKSKWHKITSGPDGKNIMYRSGKTNDWKNHFTVHQNEEFDKVYEMKMKNHPELKARIKFE